MTEPARATAIDRWTQPRRFAPCLIALAALISWIAADRAMPIPDEGALLTAAVKLLHGGVFYRDVDAYAFPGMAWLLAGAMGLFGEHVAVARALAGVVFCATVAGVHACALALMDARRAALCGLSMVALKFLAFPIYTMFFYADAAVASALLALALFLHRAGAGSALPLVGVGMLTGLSVLTKQSTGVGVAIVFAVVLAFPAFAHAPPAPIPRRRRLAAYAAGLGAVLGAMALAFALQGLLPEMWRGGLLRPFTGYLPTSGVSPLPPLAWWRFGTLESAGPLYLPQLGFELVLHWTRGDPGIRDLLFVPFELVARLMYTAIPIVFGACAWLWARGFLERRGGDGASGDGAAQRERGQGSFFTAAGVALAISVSALPRADFVHVATIYPAVVLLLFAVGPREGLGRGSVDVGVAGRPSALRSRVEAGVVLLLVASSLALAARYDALLSHRLETPRASLWVKPQHAWLGDLVDYVQANVPRGEPLFVYGHEAHWYFLTDRYTRRSFSQLYPGMTGDETGEAIVDGLRREQPRIVLQGVLRWPGMPDVTRYTPAVARLLQERYAPVADALPRPPRPAMLRIWRTRDAGGGTAVPPKG